MPENKGLEQRSRELPMLRYLSDSHLGPLYSAPSFYGLYKNLVLLYDKGNFHHKVRKESISRFIGSN